MILLDYFINLSILSLLVSTPLVIRSFINHKPFKQIRLWGGVYAGFVSVILVMVAVHYEGYVYDLRFAPVILVFAYLGPVAGLVTGFFSLLARLISSGNWYPAIAGWLVIIASFSVLHFYTGRLSALKKSFILFSVYIVIYITTIPIIFHVFRDNPFFHFQYLIFVGLGVIIGSLLIESYEKLYRVNTKLSSMYKIVANYQQELQHTLNEFNGGIFKFKKSADSFIHTFVEGKFFQQEWTANMNEIRPTLPSQGFIEGASPFYPEVWSGKDVQFEIECPKGRIGLITLHPIVEKDEVVEVIGTVIDITEKKRMEKSLEASESKYRLIAENTSDLIMVMDKEHRIRYFSPSHELVLGYPIAELEQAELVEIIHPDDIPIFKHSINKLLENSEDHSIEFRYQHKAGQWIEFESRCKPVLGEQSNIEYIVIISRDISERKKAEEILLQSEKLSVVGELAAGVAHEIRNPLTTIKGFVQLYKKQDVSLEITDLLLDELGRIESITSELLSLGKPQAVQLKRADLRDLLENTIELLLPQANMNNIQIHFSYVGNDFNFTCEKNQLKQVFLNIFKNSFEAMPLGGNIHVNLRKELGEGYLISIQDEGCGIAEELLPRLGEPFYSLKEKGTGLGVMICHKIIKQHHGTIRYHSKLNIGTLVEIRIPIG